MTAACQEIDNFIDEGNNFHHYNLYVKITYQAKEHHIKTKYKFVKKTNKFLNWWYGKLPNMIQL